MSIDQAGAAHGITYTQLPSWVRQCHEEKVLDFLPAGIKNAVATHLDLQRCSINHSQFHPRYVIFFLDDIEPESGIISRRHELTIPFKNKAVPRSRVRVRTTEERIKFLHADWYGPYGGWDFPNDDFNKSLNDGISVLVPMEDEQLRPSDDSEGDESYGDES